MTVTTAHAPALTLAEAERLTERIRLTATSFMEARDKLAHLIREAQAGEVHKVLGIASWTEYVSQVFSDTPLMRLSRVERKELVVELADEGMSTRAIAPIVGASDRTVRYDLADRGGQDFPPDAEPRQITGRDGKTYTRPVPNPASVDAKADEIEGDPIYPVVAEITESNRQSLKKLRDRKQERAEREASIVNDLRLYLRHVGTEKEILGLSDAAKKHVIEALEAAAANLKESL